MDFVGSNVIPAATYVQSQPKFNGGSDLGLANPKDCYAACGGNNGSEGWRGFCSACDSVDGARGACCSSDFGVTQDPPGCKAVARSQFARPAIWERHECVIVPGKSDRICA